MSDGLTLEEVAAKFKRGDEIHWIGSTSKRRAGHKGVGRFQGTLDGKILVEYLVSARYGQWKMTKVPHTSVVLGDHGAVAA